MFGCKIRSLSVILVGAVLMGGCTPKMGEDILIEPQGNVRWESSQTEAVLGVLSLLGVSTTPAQIRLGSDLKLRNKWHSDITVVSLEYTLSDGKEIIARGEAKQEGGRGFILASGSEKTLPLEFRISTEHLNNNRILSLLQAKKKLFIRGEAVVKIWGIEKRHPFEKEVTQLISKALKGV